MHLKLTLSVYSIIYFSSKQTSYIIRTSKAHNLKEHKSWTLLHQPRHPNSAPRPPPASPPRPLVKFPAGSVTAAAKRSTSVKPRMMRQLRLDMRGLDVEGRVIMLNRLWDTLITDLRVRWCLSDLLRCWFRDWGVVCLLWGVCSLAIISTITISGDTMYCSPTTRQLWSQS